MVTRQPHAWPNMSSWCCGCCGKCCRIFRCEMAEIEKSRTEIDVGILMELMNCRMLDTLTLKHNYLAKHGVVDIFVYAVWNQHCCVWIKQETSWLQIKENLYNFVNQLCSSFSIGIMLDIILAMWQLYLSLKYSTCFCQTVASSGQPCLNWWRFTPKRR